MHLFLTENSEDHFMFVLKILIVHASLIKIKGSDYLVEMDIVFCKCNQFCIAVLRISFCWVFVYLSRSGYGFPLLIYIPRYIGFL